MAIDHIVGASDRQGLVPQGRNAKVVYKRLPEGSPLRKLMVDCMVHEINADAELVDVPYDLLMDVFRESRRVHLGAVKAGNMEPLGQEASKRPRCYYHRHDDEYPESRCGELEES